MKRILLIAVVALGCSGVVLAQHGTDDKRVAQPATSTATGGDARVRRALTTLGEKFVVDSDNDFKLIRDTSDGRTQIAWVISKTNTYGSMEIREIISPAFKTGGALSSAMALRLLRENDKYKIGAWRLVGEGANQAIYYAIQISADIDPQSLNAAIKSATLIADALEKEIVGTDDF